MKKFCVVIITIITTITNCCVGFASPFGDKLENGISTYEKQIDMSKYKYSQEEAQNEFTYLVSRSENAWYVKHSAKFKMNGNKVDKIIVEYKYNPQQIKEKREFIDSVVDPIVEQAQEYKTDYEKAKFVYNYLEKYFDYSKENSPNLYDLVSDNKGNCHAFAQLYEKILTKLNIPCKSVVSVAMNHQWNIIEINGKWYNVDCSLASMCKNYNLYDTWFCKPYEYFKRLGYKI